MKRNTLLIGILLLSLGASAQGVSFGHFQQKKKAEARMAKMISSNQQLESKIRAAVIPVEEYTEIDEDRRYRYVYAYNSNKERSSETIYMRERENGVWGEEILYTVGTYTYEYDTQGRVKTKSVTYDNTDTPFASYRVMVTYADDGSATYTKYERDPDYGNYIEGEKWTYRTDGTLASYTCEDEYGSVNDVYTYDEQGNVTAFNSYSLSGSLNDVTLTYASEDTYESNSTWHYTYDGKTGNLLGYWQTGGSMDTQRYSFEYDAQGRIVSIKEYTGEADDEIDSPIVEGEVVTRASSVGSIIWRLAYKEDYTYFGDDAYDVANPWKAVFNMDGPVVTITTKEYNTYAEGDDVNGDGIIDERDNAENCEYESVVTFTRDANGKLTAVKETNNETAGSVDTGLIVSIDGEGQITGVKSEFKESWNGGYDEAGNWDENIQNFFYSLEEQTYTWKEGKITQMTDHEKWENQYDGNNDNGEYSYTTRYTYTDNSVTIAKVQDNVDGASTELTSMSQTGNRYMVKHWYGSDTSDSFDWETDDYIIHDIQTENVSFIRPNLKKDREGFTADVPVVLSRAGRVVCVGFESMTDCNDCYFSESDNSYHCFNIYDEESEYDSEDNLMGIYYSISHDGDLTVASNVEGLPVYVLKGSQLLKEYKYYDMAYEISGSMGTSETTRAISIPAGQSYDEISYIYNDGGLLVGQQIVSVDEDGVRTGDITLEYKYDANGIVDTEMTAQGRVCLNGRMLGLDNGGTFSVYTLSGQTLAVDVTRYTFDQSGVYVIVVDDTSIKLSVK